MSSIFLSHNSEDKQWVRDLAKRLTADGVLVWLDEAELNIGDSLIEKIADGIQNMKYVAAIISTNSIESSWVQKEISLAMNKEIAGRTVTVLPLLIEECTLPASLTDKLYADFTKPENFENEYSKLLRTIGISSNPKSKKIQIKKIEKSSKFANTLDINTDVELKIVGVDKERTFQDTEYSGLQHFYLQLSELPPEGWSSFFDKSRSFMRHSMWRHAKIEGAFVVIKCAVDELSRYHLKDLKKDVDTANKEYNKAINAIERQNRLELENQEKDRIDRDKILDQLDFD